MKSNQEPEMQTRQYQNVSTVVKINGKDVKVHGICTGSVAVKTHFRKKKGMGELAKVNILLDRHYTEYLPIWVWVIEHPDGIVVIDTGENASVNNLDSYLAQESWFLRYQFKHAAKFSVSEEDELPAQFEKLNLKMDDVKLVVLTHLHLDHTDGLKFFQNQEIIVGDDEMKTANSHMPSTYPAWFRPNRVRYQPNKVEVFNEAFPITSAHDMLYIPTPGHTRGHSSILLQTDDFDLIFAGDTSYNQGQIENMEMAGVNADYVKTRQTYLKIREYASIRNTLYLPTHDPAAGERLATKSFLCL